MLTGEQSNFLGQQIGNYEVKKLLAERAASNLYLAQSIDADCPVFLEILHPFINNNSNLAAQFQQRMENVAQLEHPSIAAVRDVGISPSNLIYAAIEYVPGVSLTQKLASVEAFTVVEALAFVRQIAGALAIAHSAGAIHHNLRPENIIVTSNNKPVLIDLGVPVVANAPSSSTANEQSDTLDYTPPEHLRGKKLTAQGNIYSLGIILYELLAGHRPQLTSSPWDIFENTTLAKEITLEEARDGLHPETYQLVRDCLRRQEWARYESMEQMIAAIDSAIAAEQSSTPAKAAAATGIPRRVWGLAAGGLALLALLLLFWFRGGRSDAQINAWRPEASVPNQGTAVLAGALVNSTATATLLPTPMITPTSVQEIAIELLAPANNSEFSSGDDITFGWTYVTTLETEQQFTIYLLSGGSKVARLGTVSEPVIDTHYRLVKDGDELDVPTGVYDWQVILEDTSTGASLALGSERAITFLVPTATSTPSPTATRTPLATPTLTPTPCIISPRPTWVRYTIQFGDALSPLAVERGTLVEEIRRVNCLEDNLLSVGQVLWLPPLPPTETPPPTATPPPSPTAAEGTSPPPPSSDQPPPSPTAAEGTSPPPRPTLTPPP